MKDKDLNRIKVVLAEQKKTAKWLADELDKNPVTGSKWCTNTTQPSLEYLIRISIILQVPIQTLINIPTKERFISKRYKNNIIVS